jgi:diguanylate cyclase (GGDEF)-like protein
MFIDLDSFKLVNDRLGHHAGDQLLLEVARRLLRALPAQATVARLGGDEFAVLLPETDVDVAVKLAAAVGQDIAQPFPGIAERVTASTGVTAVTDLERTFREADLAMYAAKSAGGGRVVAYGPEAERSLREVPPVVASVSTLRAERDRLHLEARTDALTGLPNRRALDEYLDAYEGRPVSVLFIDLDRFGAYNHRHGDHRGDSVLREVGQVLAHSCRASDRVFRKGGEEFVAVLPETEADAARTTAERVRSAVEGLGIEHGGAPDVPVVTVTIGLATHSDGNVAEALRVAGDTAYSAKVAGLRNRVAAERP